MNANDCHKLPEYSIAIPQHGMLLPHCSHGASTFPTYSVACKPQNDGDSCLKLTTIKKFKSKIYKCNEIKSVLKKDHLTYLKPYLLEKFFFNFF